MEGARPRATGSTWKGGAPVPPAADGRGARPCHAVEAAADGRGARPCHRLHPRGRSMHAVLRRAGLQPYGRGSTATVCGASLLCATDRARLPSTALRPTATVYGMFLCKPYGLTVYGYGLRHAPVSTDRARLPSTAFYGLRSTACSCVNPKPQTVVRPYGLRLQSTACSCVDRPRPFAVYGLTATVYGMLLCKP